MLLTQFSVSIRLNAASLVTILDWSGCYFVYNTSYKNARPDSFIVIKIFFVVLPSHFIFQILINSLLSVCRF